MWNEFSGGRCIPQRPFALKRARLSAATRMTFSLAENNVTRPQAALPALGPMSFTSSENA